MKDNRKGSNKSGKKGADAAVTHRPRRGRLAGPAKKRMMLYLLPEVYSAICAEADARHVSLGDLVTEAFGSRVRLVAKGA